MTPTIRILGLSMIFVLICQVSFGQDFEELITENKQTVLESHKYTYYGIDLSFLTLVNGEKLYQAEKIWKTYCPGWLDMIDEKYTPNKVRRSLAVDTVFIYRNPFQIDQYLKNSAEGIVAISPVEMKLEYVGAIAKDYHLENGSGIGLSLIVTEFNKPMERVTAYVTFFDIRTRQLLYVVRIYGRAIKAGMTRHWYYGVHDAWSDYFGNEFRHEKKKAIKQ